MFLSMGIPSPNSPGRSLDVWFQLLIDELNQLRSFETLMYDVSRKQNLQMKKALIWTINDFSKYKMVFGWSTYGKLAYLYCMKNNKIFTLTNCGKTSFFIATRDSCKLITSIKRIKKNSLLVELK
jgi:hypothetical protein